jgi:uroporphyrinogen-III synthase
MKKLLEIRIKTTRIPLSHTSIQALRNLDRYDLIVFTSKNARKFFAQELTERHIALSRRIRIIQVGPRNDLLKFSLKDRWILFPRSALAPYDIVRHLRARDAVVRVIPLYTAHSIPLSRKHKESILRGEIGALYFKSPSGVTGLLRQFRKKERRIVQNIPVQCIGKTTATAARAAGFKRVSVKGVL